MNRGKWWMALAVLSSCGLIAVPASATQTPAAEEDGDADEGENPSWLLGVGVSFGSLGFGAAGVGALPGPLYSAGVERRLADSLWLTGRLRGSLATLRSEGGWSDDSKSYALFGQIGLRGAINPADRVQLSVLSSLGASYARSRGELLGVDEDGVAFVQSYDARSWGIFVEAGLATDFWVTEMLALRLQTRLLTVGHHVAAQGDSRSRGWSADVGLSPSLAVLVGF